MSSGLELKPPSEPPSLEGLTPEARVEAMVGWFHDNYEHPDEHTPYETREGGYQWIWGGPYDAKEELADHFVDAEEDEIEAASTRLQNEEGIHDWAPNDRRVQPDDLDDLAEEQPLQERVDALRVQLDELEGAIAHLRDQAPMMGHNQPPEDMRIGLDQRDLDEAQESINEIRVELDKAEPLENADPAPLEKAQGRFKLLADKIMGWSITAGKWLGAGIGGGIGKELWEDPVALYHKIETIAGTVAVWAQYLQPPF